ncbi:hypothetical protein OIV83_001806 [Microbotryomycetes sp. JL201]|nr:hypothetical protein OIV83_001806 [Microbotryomycetes sp. JL201]
MPPAPRPPSGFKVAVLVAVMLTAGCSNSLWSKWQDMQCVENCDSPDPARRRVFEQPVWQTATMFLGEMLCKSASNRLDSIAANAPFRSGLLGFKFMHSHLNPWNPARVARRHAASAAARKAALQDQSARLHTAPLSRPEESAIFFNESAISLHAQEELLKVDQKQDAVPQINWRTSLLFWAPAACDICGTTAMNVGLLLVPVSVYQMLRGALVLWVGVFSVIFLNRKLTRAQWVALGTVMAGIAVVGASSLIAPAEPAIDKADTAEEATSPLIGVMLIVTAQVL